MLEGVDGLDLHRSAEVLHREVIDLEITRELFQAFQKKFRTMRWFGRIFILKSRIDTLHHINIEMHVLIPIAMNKASVKYENMKDMRARNIAMVRYVLEMET